MDKLELKVKGMSCSHCENAVKKAVLEINGVKNCEASAKTGIVEIGYDASVISAAALSSAAVAAIEDTGYDVD